MQSIQQELTDATEEHEGQIAGLTQEYTQKLQSTEEELARVSHELATAQNDLQAASEINEDRGREVEHTRVSTEREYIMMKQMYNTHTDANAACNVCVFVQTDIARAKERIEELSTRINELREHHKAELSAKSQEALERIDAAQSRLLLLEREMEEKERIYESEKVRVSELQQQLTLLQSSSNNKMRAAEVARTLEQQALLSDFAAQLNRVREEITQIKGVGSAEALARQKLLEKERQQAAELAEARRAAAGKRTKNTRSISVVVMGLHAHVCVCVRLSAAQAAVASLESQSGIARKHVRVRSLGPNGAPASVYSSRPTTPPTPLSARTTTSGEQQPFASAMSSPVAKANQVFSQVYEKS